MGRLVLLYCPSRVAKTSQNTVNAIQLSELMAHPVQKDVQLVLKGFVK